MIVTLDTETIHLSSEVPGGWNSIEKFGLSVLAMIHTPDLESNKKYDIRSVYVTEQFAQNVCEVDAKFIDFQQAQNILDKADLIVTFNGIAFDHRVLAGAGFNVEGWTEKSYDILAEIRKKIRRLKDSPSLDNLSQSLLGTEKLLDSSIAPGLWRSAICLAEQWKLRSHNELEEDRKNGYNLPLVTKHLFENVINYCLDDTQKTLAIFRHIQEYGRIWYVKGNQRHQATLERARL